MKSVPEIRFSKYSEDWIQDHFSDLTYPAGVKNRDNLDLPSYSITNDHGFVRQDVKFENGGTMKDADKSMYYIVSPHSFAYNPARINVGSIGYQDLDHNVIISSLYEIFKVSGPAVDKFLWWWFKTQAFKTQVKKLQEGGVRLYFFYDKLCKSILQYPKSKQEQTAIGKFFDDLDEYISSQALELQKLKNIKKACLEKMFPKEGELVPEIRFVGFEGNWERTTLNNFLETKVEKNENDKYNKYDIFSVSGEYGVVNQIEFQGKSFAGASLKGYKVTHLGQVIYTKSPLKAQPYGIIKTNNATDGIVSTLYAVYEPKGEVDTSFIQYYFELDGRLNNYLRPLVNKGAKNTLLISDDDALKGYVTFPKDVTEQKEITKYFLCLDNFIYNAVKKLDKLKQIRKGLLEKMFIANN